jgi:hypothetical protein
LISFLELQSELAFTETYKAFSVTPITVPLKLSLSFVTISPGTNTSCEDRISVSNQTTFSGSVVPFGIFS